MLVIHFREDLKSQDPEIRDEALQHLRQADVVTVIDSKVQRAILAVADKTEVPAGADSRRLRK